MWLDCDKRLQKLIFNAAQRETESTRWAEKSALAHDLCSNHDASHLKNSGKRIWLLSEHAQTNVK